MKKLFTYLMLMVGMLLPMAVNAADLKADLTIYYDVSDFGDFSGNKLQVMIGHDTYSTTYEMKAVEGYDNLYSVNIGDVNNGDSWGGATQLGFMAAGSVWGGESNGAKSQPKERIKWADVKTGVYDITKDLSGNVLFTGKATLSLTENYTLPAKTPVITVGATPEFATTTVGETATATLSYELKNADKAEVTVDNNLFSVVDNAGTITITFTPQEAGDFTATITIAAGDVKETVAISAKAAAAEAPKVPEILNVTGPVFETTTVGKFSTATVTYQVENYDETPSVIVSGEGFVIAGEEEGAVTIMFEPQAAGEFTGSLTIKAGETERVVPFTATAVEPTPIVTIKVATPENWETCYIWAWTASGDLYTDWPGEPMTKGEDGFYAIDIETSESISFLVSDNGENTKKTSDYSDGVTESTCFNVDNNALVINASCQFEVIPEPDPIEPYVSIRGLGEGTEQEIWSQAQEIKLTYQAESDNGPQWYILGLEIAEGQQFKVVAIAADATETWYGVEKVEYNENLGSYIGDDNITLPAGKYDLYFKVENTSMWIAPVTAPEPEPEPADPIITILEEDFTQNEVEVGEETEAIVVYSLENAESAVVTLEGEYFTMEEYPEEVEGEGNYIEITFAPEKAGEYTCKLTITAGEVSQVLEHTFYATEPTPDTQIISIKVAAPENWESCYLWAWEIGGKDLFDTFPGVSMPKGEDGFYVMNLEISGPIGFMVSNGAGIQTTGYTDVAEDMCFDVVSVEGNLILEVNENCEYVAPEIPKVTFTVLVPGGTQVCYIAGTPQWSPIEMEKVEGEENMFTITTDLLNGQEWKYCAGPNFDYVEVTADGGDVKNRTEYGNPDVVAAWKAVYEPQPDIPTAVEEVEALGIYATDGTIYADDAIIIYTLAGVDVTAQNGSLYGIYVVKSDKGNALISVW